MNKNNRKDFSVLPSVSQVLERLFPNSLPHEILIRIIRSQIGLIRKEINQNASSKEAVLNKAVSRTNAYIRSALMPHLKRVINGTGIILHTGLGRSPFSVEAGKNVMAIIENYCNLELDLETGERGERGAHVNELITLLTNAEASVVVNNNAAALMLVLNSLAFGKSVIVSRGELIEIGGSFRLPEIMEKSGVLLKEAGTTNKTRLSDYAKAIDGNTALLLQVHTSNYRVVGFTQSVDLTELVRLGKKRKVPVIHDLGSGALVDTSLMGLGREPVVSDSIQAGADLVLFSGDKLLGAGQVGMIIGKKKHINRIKQNPLMRALRCDKMVYSVLETILKTYLSNAWKELPVMRMLSETPESVRRRAEVLCAKLNSVQGLACEVVASDAQAGSGALPAADIPSYAVQIRAERVSRKLSRALRNSPTPILGYIRNEAFHLDLRTIRDDENDLIVSTFEKVMNND